jgi:hypothetical protein
MSVANIASSNPFLSLLQTANKPNQDLSSLAIALRSGDLTGAQSAFAAVQQDLLQTSSIPTIGSDLAQIKGALSSNDLTDAQSAFNTLLQDLQQLPSHHARHVHHHHQYNVQNGSNTPTSGTNFSVTG